MINRGPGVLMPIVAGAVLCAVTTGEPVRAVQAVTVDQVLHSTGAYVQQYERAVSAVVALESYQQVVRTPGQTGNPVTRNTRAYLLAIDMGQPGWVAFRDVFEVDGQAVREREERLTKLLAKLTPDSLVEARRIAAESARFNLNASGVKLDRTINTPMTALMFLRAANQPRSAFRLGKADRIDGVNCIALSFTEQRTPRLIRSTDNAAAQGTFWIDVTEGRVLRSELRLDSSSSREAFVRSQIIVKYARVPKPDLWLPVAMDETYELRPSGQFITGRAEYSDFREFTVTTAEGVK